MVRRIGLITNIFRDETAEVITDRKGGCGGCAQSHGCRSCLSGAKLVSTVQNPIGAAPGDVVTIDITNKGLWTGAVLFYIFPILCLILGAAIGDAYHQVWFFSGTSTPISFEATLCPADWKASSIDRSPFAKCRPVAPTLRTTSKMPCNRRN